MYKFHHCASNGRSINLKGGSATGTQSTPENFWVVMPTFVHINAFMTHEIIVATDW